MYISVYMILYFHYFRPKIHAKTWYNIIYSPKWAYCSSAHLCTVRNLLYWRYNYFFYLINTQHQIVVSDLWKTKYLCSIFITSYLPTLNSCFALPPSVLLSLCLFHSLPELQLTWGFVKCLNKSYRVRVQ